MYVPNYIPDPLEVPGNVTEEPYQLRVVYIRRVALLFLVSVWITTGLAQLSYPHAGLGMALTGLAICLIGLDLLRIALRGKPSEGRVTSLCLPIVLVLEAWSFRELQLGGWPIFQAVVGPVCIAVYTLLSDRDFSFVGCCILSLIVSTVTVAALCSSAELDRRHAAFALGTNFVLVVYLVYDLASLLARRRRGEEIAAVADLYRDVFNFLGYGVRMVKHWRKHRIWTVR